MIPDSETVNVDANLKCGVANLSVIPMRAEPSEKSEMVSQLLFGDAYSVMEEADNWLKINTFDCSYEGWIDAKLFNPLHYKDVESYLSAPKYLVRDFVFFIKAFESNITFPIFIGSSFPYPKDGILILGDSIFMVQLPSETPLAAVNGLSDKQVQMMHFAASYLQAPYLWGGRTPAGIDCSGFSQIVYKSIGIALPRDASQQAELGKTVDFVQEAEIGDLAFFHNNEGHICHVGIVCGQQKIIHASGKVRIDTLDSTGIFNQEKGAYTHHLRIVKRLID